MKPLPTDTHNVTCIDGRVREKPYKYFDCIHCHWGYWIHYQQKMPYTVCAICSDDKYERDIILYVDEVTEEQKVNEIKYSETYASFCRLSKYKKWGTQYLNINETIAKKCEIIGNIFDNPNLLKENN